MYRLHNIQQTTQWSYAHYKIRICKLQNTYIHTAQYSYTHYTIPIHPLHNTHIPTTQHSYTHYTIFIYVPATGFPIHKRARARQNICASVYHSYVRVRARIFTEKNFVVKSYLMNLSFKFRKDPSFRWGDIPLFVTMYDLELKILSSS